MQLDTIKSIDDVITHLDEIIAASEKNNDPLGYFAALYRKVTTKVKEGIQKGDFENGPRMEQFDIVFAKRYLEAYYAYQNQQAITQSWEEAFLLSKRYSPIVLQHLLSGMNAHINLDLGIAAAAISKGKSIGDLQHDFNKINSILSSLVSEVETNLSAIWPLLKKLLKRTKTVDSFLVDFSMEIARDGAWKFAETLAAKKDEEWEACIKTRDEKVARNGSLIAKPFWLIKGLLWIVRLEELGSVSNKIKILSETINDQNDS